MSGLTLHTPCITGVALPPPVETASLLTWLQGSFSAKVVKNIKVGGGLLKRDPQGGSPPSVLFIGL